MQDTQHIIEELSLEEKVSLLAGKDLWHTVSIERLNVPSIRVSDGPNGVRGAFGNIESTSACTPAGIALGATWNQDLVGEIGRVIGEEAISKDVQIVLGPTVNIQRSPLAGRNFECFSEDPFLSGELAAAYIKGVQSVGVGACIKHFVCNDQETGRFNISVEIDPRTLHEIYLEPFRKAITNAGPWAVMTAYNRVNGIHASENQYLLHSVLRKQWAYDGLILSDWFGTYSKCVIEGELDLEMPGPARWMSQGVVLAALEAGKIDLGHINSKVKRIISLTQRAESPKLSKVSEERSVNRPYHRKVIRQAGQEATVLLKNNGILPIDPDETHLIAIVGENAYYPQILGGGSSSVAPHYAVSPLDGIRKRAGKRAEVVYAPGCFIHKSLPNPALDSLVTEDGDPGLLMEFFDNIDLSGTPIYALKTKKVHFGWFDKSVPKVSQDRFSVRLSGFFIPKVSGKHTVGLNLVGWGKLEIDHNELIDTWDLPDAEGEWTKEIELRAGQKYPITIEYKWEGDGKWRMLSFGHLPPHSEDLVSEAVKLAEKADLVLVVAGLTSEWESEGFDRPTMGLPGDQDELIEQIAKVNPRTIVALNCGGPVEMPWVKDVAAVLQMWYGGQEQGNALADILFGDVSPSGKLPITFPHTYEENPSYRHFPGKDGEVFYQEGLKVGYRYYDSEGVSPLFPFGFGLSYTSFDLFDLHVENLQDTKGTISVKMKVRNIGDRAGKEVVQLYVRELNESGGRSLKQLKAMKKLMLAPQEIADIEFFLTHEAFWHFDAIENEWVVTPGAYEIIVGNSSADERLSIKINISDDSFNL